MNIFTKNLHSVHRSREIHNCALTSSWLRSRQGAGCQSATARCADLRSRRTQGTQGHYWTDALATVSKRSSTERDRFGTSEVATGGRRHSVAETHSTPSRKGLAARRVRTLQTFLSPFRKSVSAVDATLHRQEIKSARTSLAGSQTCVHTGKRRTRDQGNHRRCVAWFSSAGKSGTHRIRKSLCLRCCG